MCLILFAYKVHERYPLILAGNRDEIFSRPTAPLDYWSDRPEIVGGRDLEKMGTWLGISINGRYGAVTNFRKAPHPRPSAFHEGTWLVATLKEAPLRKNIYETLQPRPADITVLIC